MPGRPAAGREHLAQGSPELRALAAKLEQAYINKERSAQVPRYLDGAKGHLSCIKVAERKLAGREEELRRQREQEEMMLEMQILEERERRELVEEQCTKIRCTWRTILTQSCLGTRSSWMSR